MQNRLSAFLILLAYICLLSSCSEKELPTTKDRNSFNITFEQVAIPITEKQLPYYSNIDADSTYFYGLNKAYSQIDVFD